LDMHMHCILVAASNPYPLQTPVYVPQLPSLEQSESVDSDPGNQLYDAEAVAKVFPQVLCFISFLCMPLCIFDAVRF
jgi:mediator of RNA polymerase II transcription subunit 25